MSHLSRRQFLEESMLTAAAAAAVGGTPLATFAQVEKQSTSPNEKLAIATIGVNGQGSAHLQEFTKRKDVDLVAICDADSRVGNRKCEEVERRTGRRPKYVQDLRELFDDKSINCISTATPNHWHALVAIWAMQAGKDVYVEKPVSHNVSEGRRIVQVARKLGRICQTGTQCRSMKGTIDAIEYMQAGKIGEVNLARGLCYKRRPSIGSRKEVKVPDSVDYNLWTGPAPLKPSYRNGDKGPIHYDWHWFWDYGNGDLGNQGIHQMDIARWGLGVDTVSPAVLSYGGRFGYKDAGETANTQVIIHDYGPKTLVFEVRGLVTDKLKGAGVGVIFEGTDGYVVLTAYDEGAAFDKNGQEIERFTGGSYGHHFANFIKAVRSRKHDDLNADILQGHLSSALCHTGNISYRLGEETSLEEVKARLSTAKSADKNLETLERTIAHLKDNDVEINGQTRLRLGPRLEMDPQTETFASNSDANAMLTRDYRAPFVVPTADKV
ncbi:MAG: Gfo/Idh/MocA family oxidoreductase [Pirellulales bacterium]